jgi:hypothetical protein
MDLLEENPVRGVYIIREQLLKEYGGLDGWHERVMRIQEEDIRLGRKKYYTPEEYRAEQAQKKR